MKNYYNILQIEKTADKATVKAAYKRLVRKYHPDRLSRAEREDEALLAKAQEINEAYETLADDEKRKEYDRALKAYEDEVAAALSPFEKRTILVKCGKSKRTYKMLLTRKKGTKEKYKILGFEALEKPQLTGPTNQWLAKITERVLRKPWELSVNLPNGLGQLLSDEHDHENPLGVKDLDWNKACPDCKTEHKNPNGTFARWLICGDCKHIFCVGSSTTTVLKRRITRCAWCGRIQPINKPDGVNRLWGLRGEEFAGQHGKEQKALPGESPKALGDGKK